MFGKIVVGSMLAAIVATGWAIMFWMVSPIPDSVIKPLPNSDIVVGALKTGVLESGVYMWPALTEEQKNDPVAQKKILQSCQEGPLLQLLYSKQGRNPISTSTFGRGFLHHLGTAFMIAVLMAIASPKSYFGRVGFALLLGIFASFSIHIGRGVWLAYPWNYTMAMCLYNCVSVLLMGLVLAAFVTRPKREWPLLRH